MRIFFSWGSKMNNRVCREYICIHDTWKEEDVLVEWVTHYPTLRLIFRWCKRHHLDSDIHFCTDESRVTSHFSTHVRLGFFFLLCTTFECCTYKFQKIHPDVHVEPFVCWHLVTEMLVSHCLTLYLHSAVSVLQKSLCEQLAFCYSGTKAQTLVVIGEKAVAIMFDSQDLHVVSQSTTIIVSNILYVTLQSVNILCI